MPLPAPPHPTLQPFTQNRIPCTLTQTDLPMIARARGSASQNKTWHFEPPADTKTPDPKIADTAEICGGDHIFMHRLLPPISKSAWTETVGNIGGLLDDPRMFHKGIPDDHGNWVDWRWKAAVYEFPKNFSEDSRNHLMRNLANDKILCASDP